MGDSDSLHGGFCILSQLTGHAHRSPLSDHHQATGDRRQATGDRRLEALIIKSAKFFLK